MISEGQITFFKFPKTDQQAGKLRPALILRKVLGQYDDWLICMISSQLHQKTQELDEVITTEDSDFILSGLKLPKPSRFLLLRMALLKVAFAKVFVGFGCR